jgi:hypothetical protein
MEILEQMSLFNDDAWEEIEDENEEEDSPDCPEDR